MVPVFEVPLISLRIAGKTGVSVLRRNKVNAHFAQSQVQALTQRPVELQLLLQPRLQVQTGLPRNLGVRKGRTARTMNHQLQVAQVSPTVRFLSSCCAFLLLNTRAQKLNLVCSTDVGVAVGVGVAVLAVVIIVTGVVVVVVIKRLLKRSVPSPPTQSTATRVVLTFPPCAPSQ